VWADIADAFATGAYLGEGFDLPALETLLLALPISGRSRVVHGCPRKRRGVEVTPSGGGL
jgi:hypothetical protein